MRFEMIFVTGRAEVKRRDRTARDRAPNPSRNLPCLLTVPSMQKFHPISVVEAELFVSDFVCTYDMPALTNMF
jgi:hypothetical protein